MLRVVLKIVLFSHGTVTVTGSRESAVRLKRQLLSLTTDILAVVPSLHIFEKYSKKRTNKVDDMVRAHIADLSFSVRSRFDAIVDIDPDNVMKITVAGSSAVEVIRYDSSSFLFHESYWIFLGGGCRADA